MTDLPSSPLAIRLLKKVKRGGRVTAVALKDQLRRRATSRQLAHFNRLHLGSGSNQMKDWANLDIEGAQNMIWDLREPLPLESRSIRFVYTEHFIEHVSREDGFRLLANVKAAMAPGAVIRISTPDLRELLGKYMAGDLIANPEGGWFPSTLCQMVNEGMRSWGHIYVYDEEDLTNLLTEVGFRDIKRVVWGESEHEELTGIETRPYYQDLIFEASVD